VVTDNVEDVSSSLRLCKESSYHIAMLLWPIPASLKFPAIDEIAHDKKILAIDALEESAKLLSFTRVRTKMDIGNPYRLILFH
jgi:hypothetical protein